MAVCNLDAVLLEAGGAFEELASHLLAELERLFKLRLAGAGAGGGGGGGAARSASRALDAALQAAGPDGAEGSAVEGEDAGRGDDKAAPPAQPGSQLQPGRRPTAAAPWLGDERLELEGGLVPGIALPAPLAEEGSSFRDRAQADAEAAAQRLRRTLLRKLQQVEHLAAKAAAGAPLDAQQRCKLEQRPVFVSALAALDGGMAVDDVQSILRAAAAGGEADPELSASGSGAAPLSTSKQPKGKAKRKSASSAEASAADPAASALSALPAAGEPLGSALLGSSPPASSLVPAFGYAGSAAAAAAAAGPDTPSAASEQATSPAQMHSLVGFSPGAGSAAAEQAGGHQPPSLLRSAGSAGRPKSATKRKGEGARGHAWAFGHGRACCDSRLPASAHGVALLMSCTPPNPPHLQAACRCSCVASWSRLFLPPLPRQRPAAAAARQLRSPPGAPGRLRRLAPPRCARSWTRRLPAPPASPPAAPRAPPLPRVRSQLALAARLAARLAVVSGAPPLVCTRCSWTGLHRALLLRACWVHHHSLRRALHPLAGMKSRPAVESPGGSGPVRLSLASFMQSSPVAMQRGQGSRAGDGPSAPPPAWGGAAGASPPSRSHVSLRAIQEEQEAAQPPPKAYGTSPPAVSRLVAGLPPWRPPAHTPPPAGPPLLGTSPCGSASLLGTSPSGRASFVAAPVPQHSKW